MPELPEVEVVRLQLQRKIIGRTISNATVFHPKTTAFNIEIGATLKNKKIDSIDRIGKLLIINFENEKDFFLVAHLKMTGQFFFVDTDGTLAGGGHSMTEADIKTFPGKHTRVAFHFTDGSTLFFNDMRLFGYIKLISAQELAIAKAGYGPEPIDPDFDTAWFTIALRKRSTSIKALLLDQSFVAGLGNIYVDEALFRAGIRPTRQASSLKKHESEKLSASASAVMLESIAVGGTTFQHFSDTDGSAGNFTQQLQVFGRQNLPCLCCGTVIKKIRVAGRGTHFCSQCQK